MRYFHLLLSMHQLLDELVVRRLRLADQVQHRKIASQPSLTLNSYCPFQCSIGRVALVEVRLFCTLSLRHRCRLSRSFRNRRRRRLSVQQGSCEALLDEDLDFGCSGLLRGSRSFTFLMVCRLWIADFDGRPSLALAL